MEERKKNGKTKKIRTEECNWNEYKPKWRKRNWMKMWNINRNKENTMLEKENENEERVMQERSRNKIQNKKKE